MSEERGEYFLGVAGVVIKIDNDIDRTGWDQLLQAFGISEIYELPGLGHPLDRSIKIESLRDLAHYHAARLVVLAHVDGDFVKGGESLQGFEHPHEGIYIFGGSMTRLTQEDIRGVETDKVYIVAGDLFPSQAGGIVLWDRYLRGFPRGLPASRSR